MSKLIRALVLPAAVFIFYYSSPAHSAVNDSLEYVSMVFSSPTAEHLLEILGSRLDKFGLLPIVMPFGARRSEISIFKLDAVYLSKDLREGVFVKFGIAPTLRSFLETSVDIDQGLLIHGTALAIPFAVFVKSKNPARRRDLAVVTVRALQQRRFRPVTPLTCEPFVQKNLLMR